MNTTALIGGVISSNFDGDLVGKIPMQFEKIAMVREKDWVIAVGNQYGDIYRLIGVDSEVELNDVVEVLRKLYLVRNSSHIPQRGIKYHTVLSTLRTISVVDRSRDRRLKYKRNAPWRMRISNAHKSVAE